MYILTGLTKFTMFEMVYIKYATEPTKTKMFNTFCKRKKKKYYITWPQPNPDPIPNPFP